MNEQLSNKLNEEKSISNKIKELTDYIINSMMNDSVRIKTRINRLHLAYKENTIKINFIDSTEPITLYYIVYYINELRSVHDIETILYDINKNLNCSYDSVERVMEIKTINDNGYLTQEFYGSVMHEVTHMYQYDKGMGKRADLYNLVLNNISNTYSQTTEIIARVLYYTFPHEQDSFVHQFYGLLKDLEIDDDIETYNNTLNQFNDYVLFKFLRDEIKKIYKTREAQVIIREFGFDSKTFLKRINFGWQRFKRKLSNAYNLRLRELNESDYKKNINFACRMILEKYKLQEIYGDDIEFINESYIREFENYLLLKG